MAVMLNWFSICFGKNAANPAMIKPSDAVMAQWYTNLELIDIMKKN